MVDTSYFRQGWAAGFGHYPNCPPAADTSGEYSSGYAAGRASGDKLRRVVNGRARRVTAPTDTEVNRAYQLDRADYFNPRYGAAVTVAGNGPKVGPDWDCRLKLRNQRQEVL